MVEEEEELKVKQKKEKLSSLKSLSHPQSSLWDAQAHCWWSTDPTLVKSVHAEPRGYRGLAVFSYCSFCILRTGPDSIGSEHY